MKKIMSFIYGVFIMLSLSITCFADVAFAPRIFNGGISVYLFISIAIVVVVLVVIIGKNKDK